MKIYTLLWISCSLTAIVTASAHESSAAEQNWAHWRGPTADGRAAAGAQPPTEWDAEKNVRWTADIPGEGTATPIIWNNQIFVVSARKTDRVADKPPISDERSKTIPPTNYFQFLVTSFDRESGAELWQRIAVEAVPHEGHHPTHTYAASSPTTDGERLYVSFGSRGIFCYSLSGNLLWQRNLGNMRTRYGWGEAVTPVIHQGKLIINWDQEENSFITCLDAASGNQIWKTPRPNEVTSWNTPLITTFENRAMVVANGTHRVRAYDLTSGMEIWSCPGQTVNAIPSPIRHKNTVIAMSGYRGSMAVAIPLNSQGDLSPETDGKWQHSGGTPYVPSPVIAGDRLFFTGGNRDILTVLNADSGRSVAAPKRLSGLGNVYASPILAGGCLYFLGRDGTCVVVRNNDDLSVVATNRLNDGTDASPVAIGKELFLRGRQTLYCIANDAE